MAEGFNWAELLPIWASPSNGKRKHSTAKKININAAY